MSCKHGHDWFTTRNGCKRTCKQCGYSELWYLVERPNPENAPQLGQWRRAPNWRTDWADFWTDGTQAVSKEEV